MSIRALIATLLFVLTLAGASPALAHAALVSSDPADGSVVASAPGKVTLIFTEPVTPTALSVVGVGGAAQALDFTQPDGPVVEVALPSGLADGSYLLSWRVTSDDGHPVNGTVSFAIGAASGMVAAASDTALDTAIWAVRAAQYLALFLGAGSLVFGLIAALPAGAARLARALVVAGLVLVPVAIGLQGLDLVGADAAALLSGAPWSAAFANVYALTQGLLAAAFVLALIPHWRATVFAGLFGALAPVLSGHVVTAAPEWVMRATLFLHMASLMLWIGAFVPLLFQLRDGSPEGLKRFSRLIPFGVALLLASGVAMAVVQLGADPANWLSPYAVLLAIKLGLVGCLLVIGLWSRVRLTTRSLAGDSTMLRGSILVEIGLAVLIFGVVAGWRFTTPPRILAEVAAATPPIVASLNGGAWSGRLVVTPGRPGTVALDLGLSDRARDVTLTFANEAQGIATLRAPASQGDDGHWHVDSVILPVGGVWQIGADLRISDFEQRTLSGVLSFDGDIPPGILPSCAYGQSFAAGDVTISGAFARATPKGASGGGYLTITNAGMEADTLFAASSDAAGISIHQTEMAGDVAQMSAAASLGIPPGDSISLDPGGSHLMLAGLARPLQQGQCVKLVLHFARAGDLPIELNIGGPGQSEPPTAPLDETAGMDRTGSARPE